MKRQVSDRPACIECRRLHRSCPGVRPCARCLQMGLECVESVDNRTKKAKSERRAPVPIISSPTQPFVPSDTWLPFSAAAHPISAQSFGHAPQAEDWASSSYDADAWERALSGLPEPTLIGIAPPMFYPSMPEAEGHAHPYNSYAHSVYSQHMQLQPSQQPPLFLSSHGSPTASPRSTSDMTDSSESPRLDGSEFFCCPVSSCDHVYRRKGDLKTHVLQRHKDRPDLPLLIAKPRSTKLGKPYPCTIPGCPSGFTRKSGLARHLRQKHEDDPDSIAWLEANADVASSDSASPASPGSAADDGYYELPFQTPLIKLEHYEQHAYQQPQAYPVPPYAGFFEAPQMHVQQAPHYEALAFY